MAWIIRKKDRPDYALRIDPDGYRCYTPIEGATIFQTKSDMLKPIQEGVEWVEIANQPIIEIAPSPKPEITNWRVRCHVDLAIKGGTVGEVERRARDFLGESQIVAVAQGLRCERANIFGPVTPILETAE